MRLIHKILVLLGFVFEDGHNENITLRDDPDLVEHIGYNDCRCCYYNQEVRNEK